MKKLLIFFVFASVFTLQTFSQADCSNALPVCTDANSGGTVSGFGIDDFNGRTSSGCLRLNLAGTAIESNSFWFKIKLAESGEFGFNIIPNNLSEDWDFAVYGPNARCGSLGNPIACNYSKASTTGYTGVGIDPITGTKTDAYDNWMDVTAGDEYFVLVNQYSGTNAGFSITWQGAVINNYANPLDCNILVDLGEDRELCKGLRTELNATTFGANVAYEWFILNSITGNFEPFSPAQNNAKLLVSDTGTYRVEVTDTTSGSLLGDDEINVTFYDIPIPGIVSNIILCDDNLDGFENFNLDSQTNLLLNGQTGMTVTYHESQLFAQAGASPLTSPFLSSGQTIWARIENSASTSCYSTASFDLITIPPPVAVKPPDLIECDDNNDGLMIFNLDLQTPIVLNGQPAVVTYYDDEANAIDRKGWIQNTTTYPSRTKTIWVRVEPTPMSDCYSLESFEIVIYDSPTANPPNSITICDIDNDGLYQFDLQNAITPQILGTQSNTQFEVNYFPTLLNAQNNTNALPIIYTNKTPYAQERIFARIQNKDNINCFEITSFTVQVFDSPYPAAPQNIPILSYCDNNADGDDSNGKIEFDLTERESHILNGQSPFVFTVSYFEDEAHTVPIPNPKSYVNTTPNEQIIYVSVSNSNPNNINCTENTSFKISVKPLPLTIASPFSLIQCDADDIPNGITNFNLSEADYFLTLDDANLLVSYHLTENDAELNINEVNKNSFSNQIQNKVFARITAQNSCHRIVEVNLIVSVTSFPLNYTKQLVACDTDGLNDGFHEFNLAQTVSEIIVQFPSQNLRVGFYRNKDDAVNETSAIQNTTSFTNESAYSQTIWVRVESSENGGCFGIAPILNLVVDPLPEFDLDESAIVCLNNVPATVNVYNADGNYIYEWKDELGNIISTQPTAFIFSGGVYTVAATSNTNCVSQIRTITVFESSNPVITSQDIEITENTDNNTITINNSNQNLGIGDYEFALNSRNGPFQDEPIFENVPPGIHTIFVRDKNNCGFAQITVLVFGFPKFFTPNNDGFNDFWNVKGVNTNLFPDSAIYIYDRYGKLLAAFKVSDTGWDGTYNNNKVISSDYWYLAQLIDTDGNISEFKGHFSLIRR
jgi:gliding motility-associated-like protein